VEFGKVSFFTMRSELLDTVGLPGHPDDKGEKQHHQLQQQPKQTESLPQQQKQKVEDPEKENPKPVEVVHIEKPPTIVDPQQDLLRGF
jgi:hypothetical protein